MINVLIKISREDWLSIDSTYRHITHNEEPFDVDQDNLSFFEYTDASYRDCLKDYLLDLLNNSYEIDDESKFLEGIIKRITAQFPSLSDNYEITMIYLTEIEGMFILQIDDNIDPYTEEQKQ